MRNLTTKRGARYRSDPDGPVRKIQFNHNAVLDGRAVVSRLADALPVVAADLMEIATVAYAVDRMVALPNDRNADDNGGWGRSLWVEIAVREPALWRQHREALTHLLHWLTDDTWTLEFVQLDPGAGPLDLAQRALFDSFPPDAQPVLVSGGLDSACGLYLELMNHDVVAVSVHTNNWMQHVQSRVVSELSRHTHRSVVPLRYRVNLTAGSLESSQRTRGFLFLAAGISTCLAFGTHRLAVFENGIGSLNLPYLRSQLGAHATRSMHPRTLNLTGELVSNVIRSKFTISAPHVGITKAELLSQVPSVVDPILARTVSCDTGFAARVKERKPCGCCSSCLLRRQAVLASGRSRVEGAGYRDVPAASPALSAMLWQVLRLCECLSTGQPWSDLFKGFPQLSYASAYLNPAEIVRLYRSYVNEWDSLVDVFPLNRAWVYDRETE